MRNRLKLALATILLVYPITVPAQECNVSNIIASTPSERFIDNYDGTIRDVHTGLMWTKCSLGQNYFDGNCSGEPAHFNDWTEAVSSVGLREAYGYDDFRIPNIKELGSIVERQCNNPTINTHVFPSTPAATYLSSTPSPTGSDSYRTINFANGEDFSPDVSHFRFIRLVRDTQN